MVLKSPYSIAHWLLCLVRDALTNTNAEPLNRVFVGAGTLAWDDCCGTLVVSPESIFRSTTFPQENSAEEFCVGGNIVGEFLITLIRCVPTLDDRGRPPTGQQLDDAHKRILADGATIWNAINCADLPDGWDRASLRQTIIGAEGGCMAVETRVTIGVDQTNWTN